MIIFQKKYNSEFNRCISPKRFNHLIWLFSIFIILGIGCKEHTEYSKEIKQIEELKDSLNTHLQWLKSIDYQVFLDRQYGMSNDLYFLETTSIEIISENEMELISKFKDLERLFKFILKKVKWLEVETHRSKDQLHKLLQDMKTGKAAPVLLEHSMYKTGLTMQQKNRIHLKDELEIGSDLILRYEDLRNKIVQADDEYLKQSIEIRNLIEAVRNNVKKN